MDRRVGGSSGIDLWLLGQLRDVTALPWWAVLVAHSPGNLEWYKKSVVPFTFLD